MIWTILLWTMSGWLVFFCCARFIRLPMSSWDAWVLALLAPAVLGPLAIIPIFLGMEGRTWSTGGKG